MATNMNGRVIPAELNNPPKKKDLKKVVTPPFRLSFPALLEPREFGGRTTYGITMLFPPKTDMAPFHAALKEAMVQKHGSDMTKWQKLKHGPTDVIKDFAQYNANSKKPMEGDWRGWTMIRANCPEETPPSVVGPQRGPDGTFPRISDPREVYGGRWCCATINAFYYAGGGMNPGVTFGLSHVQLRQHDRPFGVARSRPEEDFEDFEDAVADDDHQFDKSKETQETTSGW